MHFKHDEPVSAYEKSSNHLISVNQVLNTETLVPSLSIGKSKSNKFKILLISSLIAFVVLLCVLINMSTVRYSSDFLQRFYDKRDSPQRQNSTMLMSENNVSQILEKNVRILCWIMTAPKNHKTKAVHVRQTWGKRCDRLVFVTTEQDVDLGETLVLPLSDSYDALWLRTQEAFKRLYQTYQNEYDWFMKADDDTYVFVENLRYMLYSYSPNDSIFFGYNFKLNVGVQNTSYMSGGAAYVVSKAALAAYMLLAQSKCPYTQGAEDKNMGICLSNAGAVAGDSRDVEHKPRFLPMEPFCLLNSNYFSHDFWLFTLSTYIVRACLDCLSKYMIAFHYVPVAEMYSYAFLNYELSVFTTDSAVVEMTLPPKLSANESFIYLGTN